MSRGQDRAIGLTTWSPSSGSSTSSSRSLVIVAFSFNKPAGKFNIVWRQFTLDNWAAPVRSRPLMDAMVVSLPRSAAVSLGRDILGSLIAIASSRYRVQGRRRRRPAAGPAADDPEIVLGVAAVALPRPRGSGGSGRSSSPTSCSASFVALTVVPASGLRLDAGGRRPWTSAPPVADLPQGDPPRSSRPGSSPPGCCPSPCRSTTSSSRSSRLVGRQAHLPPPTICIFFILDWASPLRTAPGFLFGSTGRGHRPVEVNVLRPPVSSVTGADHGLARRRPGGSGMHASTGRCAPRPPGTPDGAPASSFRVQLPSSCTDVSFWMIALSVSWLRATHPASTLGPKPTCGAANRHLSPL